MLTFDALQIGYADFRIAADFQVAAGVTAILGASGSGKSTLLAATAGFLAPFEGRILWRGEDISKLDPGKRPVSVVFQDNNLFPHLTVRQNVGLAVSPKLKLSSSDWAAIDTTLDEVGLGALGNRKPAALSGGQQSRTALARVLLADRPIVLLDEPFAALGPGLRKEMLGLVRSKIADRTVLMVTHDPDDAKAVADHIAVVGEGRITAPKDAAGVLANPPEALKKYLGQNE